MIRRLVTLLSALSLLLCIGAIVLWVRSNGGRGDQWWLAAGPGTAGLLLTSESGRLNLIGPPEPGPHDTAVRAEIARLGNERMFFTPLDEPSGDDALAVMDPMTCAYDSTMSGMAARDILRPLVDMLDDPDRFMAAHFVLGRRIEQPRVATTLSWKNVYGDRDVPYRAHYRDLEISGEWNVEGTSRLWADPGQIPTIRSHWYRQLGVVHGTIWHGWAVAAFGLLPAGWIAVRARQRAICGRRRRGNLCLTCGYDLRATPAGCPECGRSAEYRSVAIN
jgi:hypothetical protein